MTDPAIDRQSLIDKKGMRVKGTCKWIEQREEYNTWLSGDSEILWICGGPGKGKSMLSIYLTQRLELQHPGQVFYFFCSNDDPKLNTATAVLRTMMWQIIKKRPGLAKVVSAHFEDVFNEPMHSGKTQAILETKGALWQIFIQLLSNKGFGPAYCLVDGLDECDAMSTGWLASQFTRLAHVGNQHDLHIIIVSRDVPELKHVKRVRLDPDNDEKIDQDVKQFTSDRVQQLSRRFSLSRDVSMQIQKELIRKAEGTFLWIGYAMDELLTKRTWSQVEEAVSDLPVALPALYVRMLKGIPEDKQKMCFDILYCVAHAMEPVSLEELRAAIDPLSRMETFSDCVKLCEPLIQLQRNQEERPMPHVTFRFDRVVFVHQSAKDYLLQSFARHEQSNVGVGGVSMNAAHAHKTLAEICITELTGNGPLAEYASCHWFEHLRLCSTLGIQLIATQEAFFEEGSASFTRWWETFSATQDYFRSGKDQVPQLHIASHLGLPAWVEVILASQLSPQKRSVFRRRQRGGATASGIDELIEIRTGFGRRSPMSYAVIGGSTETLRYLLASGVNPNLGWPRPVELAIILDQINNTELLLEQGATASQHFLELSIEKGNPGIIRLLLEHGAYWANDHNSGSSGITMLTAATSNGQYDVVKVLLDHGSNPNAVDAHNASPLCIAVMKGHEAMVDLLIDHGADPTMKSHEPLASPLFPALYYGYPKLALKFSGFTSSHSDSMTLSLWASLMHRKHHAVKEFLQKGADPNTGTKPLCGGLGGFASLHWAMLKWSHGRYNKYTRFEYRVCIQHLLESGADPSLCDTDGKTALHYAGRDLRIREEVIWLIRECAIAEV